MMSVFLWFPHQVVCEACSAQPVSANPLLCTEAPWDSSQSKQTGWPANSPPTASLLYRSPCSASLLGLLVPQHSTPDPNTGLVWKAQNKGITWWVPQGFEWLLLHWWVHGAWFWGHCQMNTPLSYKQRTVCRHCPLFIWLYKKNGSKFRQKNQQRQRAIRSRIFPTWTWQLNIVLLISFKLPFL